MRASIASLFLTAAIGLGVAGCGVDPKGFGGTGGGTGSQGGAASGGAGGGGGSTITPGADAATDGCAGMPIPAIACAFGRTVPVCERVLVAEDIFGYRWTITCPDQPPASDGGLDVVDSDSGTGDGAVGDADAGTGTGDGGRTDVSAAIDARADVGAADAGKACTSSVDCGSDQVCTTVDGVCNLPPGCATGLACPAVCYGTCRSADIGPACGNTICPMAMTCCNASCGTCVAPGVGCTKQLCLSPACEKDSDCQSVADYCTGCDCRSLAKGTSLPGCSGPGVRCLVDPCLNKVSSCVSGQCALAVKN